MERTIEFDSEERCVGIIRYDEVKMRLKGKTILGIGNAALFNRENIG